MFFARTVAHTLDVDAMLDTIEPWQFKEWMAEYKLQPWGIEAQYEPEKNTDSPIADSFNSMRRMTGV